MKSGGGACQYSPALHLSVDGEPDTWEPQSQERKLNPGDLEAFNWLAPPKGKPLTVTPNQATKAASMEGKEEVARGQTCFQRGPAAQQSACGRWSSAV